MRLISIIVMSILGGLVLGMSLFIYAAHRLRISPWFYPPRWFFLALVFLVVGVALEIWLACRARRIRKDEDTGDDRRAAT